MSRKIVYTTFFLSIILVFVIFSGVAESKVVNSQEWVTYQADAQRTGYTPSLAPNGNQTFWKFQTSGPIKASPVATGGRVFVGSTDGYLYAVNATNGAKLWEFWAGSAVNTPTIGLGKVFITCDAGIAYALDVDSGTQIWNKSLGGKSSSASPLLVGSRIFVGGNQIVYALNEAVGVRLFDETIRNASDIERLIYADGLVIAVAKLNSNEIRLTGFEAKNDYARFGVTLFSSGSDRLTSFLTDEAAKIFCVAPTSEEKSAVFGLNNMGMIMWEHQVNGVTNATPANAYDVAYVTTSRFIYALNMTNGALKWCHPTSGASSASSPAVADGKVYFGLDDGYVYSLDAYSGDLIWSYKTNGPVQSSPAISDGLLFVGSDDGNLYAIGYPTTQSFDVKISENTSYEVKIQSSLAVSDFNFNGSLKQFSFQVNNEAGKSGFCNVSFPYSLLKGSYTILANENSSLLFEEYENGSQVFLYFNILSDVDIIRILGTEAIAEFPSGTSAVAILVITATIAAVYKSTSKKTKNKRW